MRCSIALAVLMLTVAAADAIDGSARHMSDEDFFLDRKELLGKHVEVASNFKVGGDILFMSLKDDSNATFVNMDKLPRDVRKDVHSRCQNTCAATVMGVVAVIGSPFGNDVGIIANRLVLTP